MKRAKINQFIKLLSSDLYSDRSLGEGLFSDLPLGERSDFVNSNELCKSIYQLLKDREINPSGTFDKSGRFYADNSDLINVRRPSFKWPYSEMIGCRTMKYVKALRDKHFKELVNCKNPYITLKYKV